MPTSKPSGQKVRVSFSVRRPKTAKAALLQAEVEKFVKKHGGKIKKKKNPLELSARPSPMLRREAAAAR